MKNRPHTVPALIAAAMLLIAIAPLPYGYYQFLRWVVCGISIYMAIGAYRWAKNFEMWLFFCIAVLFNPLIPVTFEKNVWQIIDAACAVIFGISLFYYKAEDSNNRMSE